MGFDFYQYRANGGLQLLNLEAYPKNRKTWENLSYKNDFIFNKCVRTPPPPLPKSRLYTLPSLPVYFLMVDDGLLMVMVNLYLYILWGTVQQAFLGLPQLMIQIRQTQLWYFTHQTTERHSDIRFGLIYDVKFLTEILSYDKDMSEKIKYIHI